MLSVLRSLRTLSAAKKLEGRTLAHIIMTAAQTNNTPTEFDALHALVSSEVAESNLANQLQSAANCAQIRGVVYDYNTAVAATDATTVSESIENSAVAQPACASSATSPVAAATCAASTDKVAPRTVSEEETAPKNVTYLDCLMGRAPIPRKGINKLMFTLLMVGGMVTFMTTFNGVSHSGLAFFAQMHWMYPLIFALAFLVRIYIADKIVNFVAPRFLLPRFHGLARPIAMTALNVCVMAPIMASIITLLLHGPNNYLAEVLVSITKNAGVAAFVSFFVVGPAVKMLYNNVVAKRSEVAIFRIAHKYAMPWTAIFSN